MDNIHHKRKRTHWGPKDENDIILLWEEFQNDLSKEKRKSHVYVEMSKRMSKRFSVQEVHVKIRNLKQKFRAEEKEINSSGESQWEHYNRIKKIFDRNAANNSDFAVPFCEENSASKSFLSIRSCDSKSSEIESEPLKQSTPKKSKYHKEIVDNIKKQTQLHEANLAVVKNICEDFSFFLQRQEQRDNAFLEIFKKLEESLQ